MYHFFKPNDLLLDIHVTFLQNLTKRNFVYFGLVIDLVVAPRKEVTDNPSTVKIDMKIDIITSSLTMMTSKHNRYGVDGHLDRYAVEYTGGVNKNARRLKKSCSLHIKAMILKTVLFYSRYVKLGSVIYPALIGNSFPSKYEIFCRKPLSKAYQNE